MSSDIMAALRDLTASTTTALDGFRREIAENVERSDRLEKTLNRQSLFGVGGDSGPRDLATARNALAAFAKTGALDAQASMSTVIDPDGGYIVAPELDTRIQQLQRNLSPMRRIARIVQTKASSYQLPVNVGGTASGWVGETAARPETASPDLALLDFPAGEIYAMPAVTQRLLDDSPVNIAQFLEGEIAKEFGEKEGTAFLTGNGINKPSGLLAAPTATTDDGTRPFGTFQSISSGNASAITADGLINFVYRLKVGYRTNGTWLMNSLTLSAIRQLKDNNGRYIYEQSYAAGTPSTLLGFPVEIDESMPSIAAGAFPIAFGDFQAGYLITDRLGIRILRDPFSNKPYVMFYATKRVGGGPLDSNAIKFLQIGA
jgi:HK97 family phage major capsid protein